MDKEISVREGLSNGANLKALLQQSVDQKPKGHELASSNYPEARRMAQIGG